MCYLAAEILLLLLFETVSHYESVTAFEVLILQAHPMNSEITGMHCQTKFC